MAYDSNLAVHEKLILAFSEAKFEFNAFAKMTETHCQSD